MLAENVSIIGLGLIGGSLARALKRAGLCNTVRGYGRREAALQQAVEDGVIDDYSLDLREAVAGADLVVLATPLTTTEALMREMSDVLKPECIITDVGSAKGVVVAAARKALAGRLPYFVPAHPIAGTEKSGVGVAALWRGVGATVVDLDVEHHDEVLAATSHLPHVLVYTLIDCLAQMQDRNEIFRYAAGGFADFTRVASSSPEMWRDICIANKDSLLAVLDRFEMHLNGAREAIAAGDGGRLMDVFSRAKQARDAFARNTGR